MTAIITNDGYFTVSKSDIIIFYECLSIWHFRYGIIWDKWQTQLVLQCHVGYILPRKC